MPTVTWFGHSAFKIETNGISLLIDPFLDGNPTSPVASSQVGQPQLILITHDHDDHVGQAVEIAKASGATVVGVYDTILKLVAAGLPEAQALGMNLGGTVERHGQRIKMVQAVHSSASGCPAGYILTLDDGFCLYHAGDTALFATMELFAKFHEIDLALLPIGGHFTMDPEQAAYACSLLQTAQVAPMHWGTFPVLEQGLEGFRAALATYAPDTELLALTPGKPQNVAR